MNVDRIQLTSLIRLTNKMLYDVRHDTLIYLKCINFIKNILRSSQCNTIFGSYFGKIPQKFTKRIHPDVELSIDSSNHKYISSLCFYGGDIDNTCISNLIDNLNQYASNIDYKSLIYTDISHIDLSYIKNIKF